jgi:3-hydroxybutyryl-CoA dehydratase
MPIDIGPGYYFEDMSVGMEASSVHTVTAADIESFAHISGDHNPVHIDEAYAATTRFQQRIAHGALIASYISAALGMKLPGPGCVYVSQTLNFKAPVPIGAEVIATVMITDLIPEKKRVIFSCVCRIGDEAVIEGEAVMKVPSRASKT